MFIISYPLPLIGRGVHRHARFRNQVHVAGEIEPRLCSVFHHEVYAGGGHDGDAV